MDLREQFEAWHRGVECYTPTRTGEREAEEWAKAAQWTYARGQAESATKITEEVIVLEDVVRKLREGGCGTHFDGLAEKAAYTIEALQKEIEELRARVLGPECK